MITWIKVRTAPGLEGSPSVSAGQSCDMMFASRVCKGCVDLLHLLAEKQKEIKLDLKVLKHFLLR